MRIFIVPFLVLIADQLTKLWVKSNFNPYIPTEILGKYVRITYCENPGIAFGIQVGQFIHVVTVLSVIFTIYICYYLYSIKDEPSLHKTGIALILGGAFGNVLDRAFMVLIPSSYSGVVDFIDIGISDSLRWYIFNVADASISVGIVLYILFSFQSQQTENSIKTAEN